MAHPLHTPIRQYDLIMYVCSHKYALLGDPAGGPLELELRLMARGPGGGVASWGAIIGC